MPTINKFTVTLIAAGIAAGMGIYPLASLAQTNEQNVNDTASPDETTEVIIIRGLRASLIQSQNNKRFSNSIVDSITATDIGKLPDATIADSLQRITGVQINRSGGEGSSVNIRGANQVGVTLNGEQMLSAGAVTTVQPNFTDVPSTMVSGLDVMKTTQASNIAGGISGLIDIKTYRPLQLDRGFTLNAKAEATDGSMGDETDTGLSTFIGYNNDDNFGATLNISTSTVNLADYVTGSTGNDWGFVANEANTFVADNVDVNGDGDSNDSFYSFQGHQAGNQFIERDRLGVNGSIEWQINNSFRVVGDVFYTDMEEFRTQSSFIASMAWQAQTGWFNAAPNGLTAHENIADSEILEGNLFSFNAGTLQARRAMVHSEADAIEKEALNTNLELHFDNGGDFTGSVRWVHGEARHDNAFSAMDAYINSGSQVGATFKGPGGVPVGDVNPWGYDGISAQLPDGTSVDGSYTMIPIGIDYTGGNQAWSLPGTQIIDGETITEVFGSNIARYSATSASLTGAKRDAELDVFRIDGNYAIDWRHISDIDAGLRAGNRTVKQESWIGGVAKTNEYGDAFLSRWKDSASQAPETGESFIEQISFESLESRGYISQQSDFIGTSGLGSLYFIDPNQMRDPLAWHTDVYGTNIQSPDGANSYNVDETTTEAYVQANLNGEIAGITYRGNVGIRYINTELDIDQSLSEANGMASYNGVRYIIDGALGMRSPATGVFNTKRDYTDILPSINLAFDIAKDQIVRFSYTKNVTPHNTNNLAGGVNVTRLIACDLQKPDGTAIFCATQASQQGNPSLEPWRSTNYDVSYEWYFSQTGMFSLAAFYLDFETTLERTTVFLPFPDSDGEVRGFDLATGDLTGLVPTTTQGNTDGGSVKGLEISYQQGFDFLDGPWSGLGTTINYTYSPTESSNLDYYGQGTPLSDNSEHQANFALWYEKDALQARIAANYRSETYTGQRAVGLYRFARYTASTIYLDASVSYDINESFTVSLQGTNLTEETRENYYQWADNIDKTFYNERRLSLSVQYRLN
jgi:iron complex outermembrane receptor protein